MTPHPHLSRPGNWVTKAPRGQENLPLCKEGSLSVGQNEGVSFH